MLAVVRRGAIDMGQTPADLACIPTRHDRGFLCTDWYDSDLICANCGAVYYFHARTRSYRGATVGTARAPASYTRRPVVLDLIRQSPNGATSTDIADATGIGTEAARNHLRLLARQGLIRKGSGWPRRWWPVRGEAAAGLAPVDTRPAQAHNRGHGGKRLRSA